MLTLRFALLFAIFMMVGTSAAIIVSSGKNSIAAILVLLATPAVLLLTKSFTQALRKGVALCRSLTWWQALWALMFVSGLVFRGRDRQDIDANPVDAWVLFRVGLVGLIGILLLGRQALRKTLWFRHLFRGAIAALTVYCLICVTSVLWSVFPAWTFYKSVEFFVDVALLAALIEAGICVEFWKTLLDWTWLLVGLLLASVWIGLLLWPEQALRRSQGIIAVQLAGVIPDVDSNSVGEVGAVIAVVAFCRLLFSGSRRNDRIWYVFLLIMGLFTMYLAQARSAVMGFAVGTALLLLFSRRAALTAGFCLVSGGLLTVDRVWRTLLEFMRRGETDEYLYNLSSRVEWWSFAWPKITNQLATGYGAYAGARFFVMAEYKVDAGIHSDWVEILVGTGLCGFVPALVALLTTWYQLLKSTWDLSIGSVERQVALEAISVFAVMSVRSIFSPALFLHPPTVFFAVVGCAEFLRTRQKQTQPAMSPLLVNS